MRTTSVSNDFNALISAPKFSDDPVGRRQMKRWQLIAEDIYKSMSINALLEARGKAEGYIHGLVDAGAFIDEGHRARLSHFEYRPAAT